MTWTSTSVSDAPLTPLSFLERSADVWADRTAVADRGRTWTYAEHHERVRRAADSDRELAFLYNLDFVRSRKMIL